MSLGLKSLMLVIALSVFPAVGLADTVTLGYVSFDLLISSSPGTPGVNGFTIGNLTGDPSSGGNDVPPDFPVFNSITFLNSSLEWFSGASSGTVFLGDLGPGFFNPVALQFPDTETFSSAIFTGTLDTRAFQLDPLVGGGTFNASSDQIAVQLLPSHGTTLVAGTDFALINVSNQPTSVPEPGSAVPLTCLLLGLRLLRRLYPNTVRQRD